MPSEEIRDLTTYGNTQVEFEYFKNAGELNTIKGAVDQLQAFIPPVFREIVFSLAQGDGGTTMEAHITGDYRYAKIYTYPAWFRAATREQLETLLHEFIHLHHEPVLNWTKHRVIAPVKPRNEELHEYLDKEFESRCERFTEDLMLALSKILFPR